MTLLGEGARLVDAVTGRTLRGAELAGEVAREADALAALPRGAVFVRAGLDSSTVLRYLGAFESRRAVALLDSALDQKALTRLLARFRPAALLNAPAGEPPCDYVVKDGHWVRTGDTAAVIHPDLAVLLLTSGSTGSPRLVRLSREAILSNARAIADVLSLSPDDVAPTSLPLHYSYGLSVLNSHLVRGATVVVEPSGLLGRGFWDTVAAYRCTSIAAVPHHYDLLRRLDFQPARYPCLRTLTQAGGKLRAELITEFARKMHGVGGRLYVMYGQTEASPRMSTMPAERLVEKPDSVGPALPGGRFSIRHNDGSETTHPKITGEVVYRGPNVMMGYAEHEDHLALGDQTGGVLSTGDLGYLDEEGFLFVAGRLNRLGSVFGNRLSLDDLEQAVRATGLGIDVVAAVPADDKVVLFAEGAATGVCERASHALADRLHLHSSGFDVRPIAAIPVLASGKIDYQRLTEQV